MNIGWVIPDIKGGGSGGGNAILDHIKDLSELYNQTIYSQSTDRLTIESLYGKLPDNVKVKNVITEHNDLIIGTWWETIKTVLKAPATHKAYFIQDLEQMFYPVSDNYFGVLETYKQGLIHIARGEYIQKSLNAPYCINFGANEVYKPLNMPKQKAICFLYQPQKPHRCSEMGLKALRAFKQVQPEYNVYLYGSDINISAQQTEYPEFTNLGLLNFEDCNKLYNICELGICFSPTNPSNIPYEMMAAGLPCLDLNTNNKQDLKEGLLYLAQPNVYSITMSIIDALNDTDKLELTSRAGLHFMKERPLSLAFAQMRAIVEDIFK